MAYSIGSWKQELSLSQLTRVMYAVGRKWVRRLEQQLIDGEAHELAADVRRS